MDKAKDHIDHIPVRWAYPRPGALKLNSDGCAKGNPGKSGGGGVVRDENGCLKVAYGRSFGMNTNNMAEALALEIGLEWCVTNGVRDLEVELDSKLLVEWITNRCNPPWKIWSSIRRIKNLLDQVERWRVSHCFREGNKVADGLANWGMQFVDTHWIHNSQRLPREVRGALNMDKWKYPSFRKKHIKNSFYIDRNIYRNYTFDVP